MTTRLHLVRRSMSTALLLAVAGMGCASDPATEEDPDVDPMDTTAPLIVDTLPAAGATGVAATEAIHVTFSEQMDPATVEAAYSSTDLPLEQVALAWSPDGTTLTITPSAPLAYAEGMGNDPSAVTPKSYAITIGTEAADLAGNPLEAPVSLSFATRRRMTTSFAHVPDLTKALNGANVLAGVTLFIGDSATPSTYRSYVTFNLAALPAGSEVETAEFEARQLAPYGAPYSLGAVMLQHLTFSTMDDVGAAMAISLPGAFSEDAVLDTKRIDVSSQVQDDVINRATRGDRSQYRLQIDQATNGDNVADTAVFQKNTLKLTTVYVVD